MSNQSNSFSSPLNNQIVEIIDNLNLSTLKKQHLRLLAHCLAILKEIAMYDVSSFDQDKLLREWCDKKAQRFNDKKFNELLYEQMSSAYKKLKSFSIRQEKEFKDLDLEDLITLVQENTGK